LKIKCADSRVNAHILASNPSVPFTLTTVHVPNFKFNTNLHKTDNSV
jgi:hypothetical protein